MPPDHDDVEASFEGSRPPPATVIEAAQRLSRSMLWRLQRRYFDEAGVSAWSTTTVPHYVTSNPALAQAYAEVALGFLRDCGATLDPTEPVTLIELGSGSGRFSFLFLRAFTALLARSPFAGLRFRYVMTDVVEKNLAFFRAHPRLQPFVARGELDFARFDVEHDVRVTLENAGVILGPGSLRNAPIVIANYVFDGISQDAFFFKGGQLRECLFSLTAPESLLDPADPALLGQLALDETQRPAALDYYGEPALDELLGGYAARLDGVRILFPSAALRCIARLAALGGGRMLLLSGDRGEIREDAVGTTEALGLARHGSFSLPVNYHAIAERVRADGGRAMTTEHAHVHLNVLAFALGEHPTGWLETRLAYEQRVGQAGPDDFFVLRRALLPAGEGLTLDDVLSLIRVSRWDPRVLGDCLFALWQRAPDAPSAAKAALVKTIQVVWENYYWIGEELDLAFELGLLLDALGAKTEALWMFHESERLHGEDPRARWNAGLCHFGLGRPEEAARCFVEAARLDGGFRPAGSLQIKRTLG